MGAAAPTILSQTLGALLDSLSTIVQTPAKERKDNSNFAG